MRTVLIALALGACAGDADKSPTTSPTAQTGVTDTAPPLPRPDAILALTGDPVAGEQVYDANCSFCHGVDGLGGANGPSLVERLATIDEAAIVTVLLEGAGNMSAFSSLEDQQLADVSAYIRQAFGP